MGFTENVKEQVMRKAGFCCCVCRNRSVSIEVHHIIPQKDGGDDCMDNAAALCPSCHADYGDNPTKRRRIKTMRDWWYDQVAKMYSGNIVEQSQLGEIHCLLRDVHHKQDALLIKDDENKEELERLKLELKRVASNTIDNMTVASSDVTTSGVISTAVSSVSSINVAGDAWNVKCGGCGKPVSGLVNYCPYCGASTG